MKTTDTAEKTALLERSCEEKERLIDLLKKVSEEKEREIQSLKRHCDEKDRDIQRLKHTCVGKDREINMLSMNLAEARSVINSDGFEGFPTNWTELSDLDLKTRGWLALKSL